MKSMTDFIMEQEMPSVEEEVFSESALVSQFMGMQAAAAEMNCIYEYASIATFCESNDIEIPEMLVQEGFKDVMDKIWTGISNFFKKIADWFKSLVKGTVSTFSASKLNEIIAKLKTYSLDTDVEDTKIVAPLVIYLNILGAMEAFRELVIHPIAENTVDESNAAGTDEQQAQKKANDFIANLDGFIEDLKKIKESSNWKNVDGAFVDGFELPVISKYTPDTTDPSKALLETAKGKSPKIKYQQVVDTLEKVNRLDIPKTGTKLLSELHVDVNKFTTSKNDLKTMVSVKVGDDPATVAKDKKVNEISLKKALNDVHALSGGTVSKEVTVEVTRVATWVSDSDVQKKIKETADLLAVIYDKAKTGLSDTAAAVFKDLKKAEGEDANKTYQDELKGLNSDTNRDKISKNRKLTD